MMAWLHDLEGLGVLVYRVGVQLEHCDGLEDSVSDGVNERHFFAFLEERNFNPGKSGILVLELIS